MFLWPAQLPKLGNKDVIYVNPRQNQFGSSNYKEHEHSREEGTSSAPPVSSKNIFIIKRGKSVCVVRVVPTYTTRLAVLCDIRKKKVPPKEKHPQVVVLVCVCALSVGWMRACVGVCV